MTHLEKRRICHSVLEDGSESAIMTPFINYGNWKRWTMYWVIVNFWIHETMPTRNKHRPQCCEKKATEICSHVTQGQD